MGTVDGDGGVTTHATARPHIHTHADGHTQARTYRLEDLVHALGPQRGLDEVRDGDGAHEGGHAGVLALWLVGDWMRVVGRLIDWWVDCLGLCVYASQATIGAVFWLGMVLVFREAMGDAIPTCACVDRHHRRIHLAIQPPYHSIDRLTLQSSLPSLYYPLTFSMSVPALSTPAVAMMLAPAPAPAPKQQTPPVCVWVWVCAFDRMNE